MHRGKESACLFRTPVFGCPRTFSMNSSLLDPSVLVMLGWKFHCISVKYNWRCVEKQRKLPLRCWLPPYVQYKFFASRPQRLSFAGQQGHCTCVKYNRGCVELQRKGSMAVDSCAWHRRLASYVVSCSFASQPPVCLWALLGCKFHCACEKSNRRCITRSESANGLSALWLKGELARRLCG